MDLRDEGRIEVVREGITGPKNNDRVNGVIL